MAGLHTPRELELIIKHELSREREIPEELIVQIFRDGEGWRAGSRFRTSRHHGHSPTFTDEIAGRVAEIGSRVAKHHRLIG